MRRKIDWASLVGRAIGEGIRMAILGICIFKGTGNSWLALAAIIASQEKIG